MCPQIQTALRHKSEIEHHRNKIRLRAKRRGHYEFPVVDDLLSGDTRERERHRVYRRAQMQIDKILDPTASVPSVFIEPRKRWGAGPKGESADTPLRFSTERPRRWAACLLPPAPWMPRDAVPGLLSPPGLGPCPSPSASPCPVPRSPQSFARLVTQLAARGPLISFPTARLRAPPLRQMHFL